MEWIGVVAPLIIIGIFALFIIVIMVAKRAERLIKDPNHDNKMIACPVCHGQVSLSAESCPSCGNRMVLADIKKKYNVLTVVSVIVVFLSIGIVIFSGIKMSKANKRAEDLYDTIQRNNSSLLDYTIHLAENYEKQGLIDTIKGKDPVVDEYNECIKDSKTYGTVVIASVITLGVMILVTWIGTVSLGRKVKKYLKTVSAAEPGRNVGNLPVTANTPIAVNPPVGVNTPIAANPPVAVNAPIAANTPIQNGLFCTNCGNQLNPGAAFCPMCGNKVQ